MNEQLNQQIESYLYGSMPQDEVKFFESAIADDKSLAEAVELARLEKQALRLLAQDQLRSQMTAWKAEKAARTAPENGAKIIRLPSRQRLLYRLSAAASVLLLLGLPFWYANNNFDNQALTADVLGLQSSLSDRSNMPDDNPLLQPMEAAQQGQTEAALAALLELEGTAFEANALLLAGEIYTESARYTEARELYLRIIRQTDDLSVRQKAEWQLANVYLATGDEPNAIALLADIADNPTHSKEEEATALLQKLNSFWRKLLVR